MPSAREWANTFPTGCSGQGRATTPMAMRPERERLRGLYAVTPESDSAEGLAEQVSQCIAGGAALVQYRAKRASGASALVQARALAAVCRRHHVPLVVNDSIALASAVQAD